MTGADRWTPAGRTEPAQHNFQGSGARLTWFEWGKPGGQTVFLVHATGFHGRCWDEVVAALPADFHVIAVEMRGHGRSERVPPYIWASFARDVTELVDHLGLKSAIGVGHSMGGHALVQVCARLPGAFERLLLVDPVIFEPDAYVSDRYRNFQGPEDHPVSKRRNQWTSWEEMYERFADRGSFALWKDQVLRDYCRHGVVPAASGEGFELACPPLVEASVYLGNTGTDVHDLMPGIDIPVVVLRARGRDPDASDAMDFSRSPTWEKVAAAFPKGRDVYLPHLTHFIPMQDPQLVARFIVDADATVSSTLPEGG